MKKEIILPTCAKVSVNDDRVRVDLPSIKPVTLSSSIPSYQSISSAILNGGHRTFPNSSLGAPTKAGTKTHVINCKVPSTYDGVNPPPLILLSNFAKKESLEASNTIGLLTAASMDSVATSSRSAKGVYIDVIVTAGLSNSRSIGADADYFVVCENDNINNNCQDDDPNQKHSEKSEMTPGTINTIIIVNTSLSEEAMVEAYSIAIEAKCSACVDHGIVCAKDATKFAMGTGTDCCVLLSPCAQSNIPTNTRNDGPKGLIKHAGKHTLFAEMVGQAVHEATSEAIMINIRHLYGHYFNYAIQRMIKSLIGTMKGARPCIPPRPMMPVPNAPPQVLMMGIGSVLLVYISPINDKAKLLLAAVAWDRYLGEPPLKFHPVCLAGSAISFTLAYTPNKVYKNPLLGFACGLALLICMLLVFTTGAWTFIQFTDRMKLYGPVWLGVICKGYCNGALLKTVFNMSAWILQLLLLKSTFSLQLLCTIALQMARFLERDQIADARAQLSWLCSRDPTNLNSADLAGGTLESLSENLSDGFVAPLFWYVIFGPIGALTYRVANTLDSRIGYRGNYEWFGKPSARFDDLINIPPARITALLLAAAATLVSGTHNTKRGLAAAWRDCNQCDSPNAGWPMACFAGVLGVQLSKEGAYCLGSKGVKPEPKHVHVGCRVAQMAGGIAVLVAVFATTIIR